MNHDLNRQATVKIFQLPRLIADLLALLSGVLLVFAFAPFNLFFLGIVAPALLFWLLIMHSVPRAIWRGWLFGVGLFGGGVYWLHISLSQFGGIHIVTAIGMTAALVMFLALYPAIFALCLRLLSPRHLPALQLLIIAPALWVGMEWIRSWLFTGFPWLLVGYSQIDSPLAHFAPIVGVYGLTWASIFSAGALVYFLLRHSVSVLLVLMLLWNTGWMLQTQTWTTPVGEPIKVALIQANTAQDMKFMVEAAEPIMQGYYDMSKAHRDADLIIWPETAIPIMFHDAIPFLQTLLLEAQAHDTQFLIGIPIQSPEDNLYYNTVMQLSKKPQFYHKRHLVPFGEYLPARQLINTIFPDLYIPMSDFNAGKTQQNSLKIGNTVLGISICYEAIFPEEIRRALPEAGILINISNDGWFGDSIAAQQHLQMARMRALENGRPLLRATNTGLTVIIDAKGQVIKQAPQFKPTALRAEIRAYEGSTPYQTIGEKWILLLIVVSLLMGFVAKMEN